MSWTEVLSAIVDWLLLQSTRATFRVITSVAVILNLTAATVVYFLTRGANTIEDRSKRQIDQTLSVEKRRADVAESDTDRTSVGECSDFESGPSPRVDNVIREIIDFWDKAKEEIVRMAQLDISEDVKNLLLKTIQEGYNRLRCKLLHELELPQERVEWLLGYEQGYHSQIIHEMRRVLMLADEVSTVKTETREPDLIQPIQSCAMQEYAWTEDKAVQSDVDLEKESARKQILDFSKSNDEVQKAVENLLVSLEHSIKERRRFRTRVPTVPKSPISKMF